MLTREEDVDAHALRRRGWSISAIARHLGKDRKNDPGVPGRGADRRRPRAGRRRTRSSRSWRTAGSGWPRTRTCGRPRCSTRSPQLGYDRSYPPFTRELRVRGLRPVCEPCQPAEGRPVAVIDHPPGRKPNGTGSSCPTRPPAGTATARRRILLVGALSHSGKWRGVLAESTDQPHLIDAQHRVATRLGRADQGLAVRPDGHRGAPGHREGHRLLRARSRSTIGVQVQPCPPRRGNRKGVVEKANHTAAQRWWRTLPDDVTVAQAQARLDEFCAARRPTPATASTPTGTVAPSLISPPRERLAPGPGGRVPDRGHACHGHGHRAGAGVLPREPVLGAARAGRRPGHRDPPARLARCWRSSPTAGSPSPCTTGPPTAPAPPIRTDTTSPR